MSANTLTRKALLLTLGGILTATLGFSQGPPQGRGGRGGGGFGPQMLERLQTELKLSDEQMDKLKPILDENAEKMGKLREKFMSGERTPESREAMFAERQKMQEEMNKKVAEVLTKEQMEGWEKMQQQMRERRGGRGGRGGRRGGPPQQ